MYRLARTALLACAIAAPIQTVSGASIDGAAAAEVRHATPVRRIVALAPHLAEIAFAAGAGGRLVGVARFSDFPLEARTIPQIGDASRVDLERIQWLKPDLILAWKSGNQAGDIARLERLGHSVFTSEPRRLEDIAGLVRAVGKLAGSAEVAENAALAFEAEIAGLRARYAGRPPVRVFYEIWHRPLLTVSGAHMISDVIALCGGINVFAEVPVLTPSVSIESVLAARPQAVLGGSSSATPEQFAAQWRDHPVAALRRVHAFYISPDEIQRATPRIVNGARAICGHLDKVRLSR